MKIPLSKTSRKSQYWNEYHSYKMMDLNFLLAMQAQNHQRSRVEKCHSCYRRHPDPGWSRASTPFATLFLTRFSLGLYLTRSSFSKEERAIRLSGLPPLARLLHVSHMLVRETYTDSRRQSLRRMTRRRSRPGWSSRTRSSRCRCCRCPKCRGRSGSSRW